MLRADPSVCSRNLQPGDRFLIFASDGLWELISNQKAVEIVHNNPREVGISFIFYCLIIFPCSAIDVLLCLFGQTYMYFIQYIRASQEDLLYQPWMRPQGEGS